MTPLTKTQSETLQYLRQNKEVYMPSIPEIAKHFGIAISSAWERLERLESKGLLIKWRHQPRGIKLV